MTDHHQPQSRGFVSIVAGFVGAGLGIAVVLGLWRITRSDSRNDWGDENMEAMAVMVVASLLVGAALGAWCSVCVVRRFSPGTRQGGHVSSQLEDQQR